MQEVFVLVGDKPIATLRLVEIGRQDGGGRVRVRWTINALVEHVNLFLMRQPDFLSFAKGEGVGSREKTEDGHHIVFTKTLSGDPYQLAIDLSNKLSNAVQLLM